MGQISTGPADLFWTAGPDPDRVWLVEQLARYTYRPGWTLSIDTAPSVAGPAPVYRLVVEYQAADSYHPDQVIPLKSWYFIPWAVLHERSEDGLAHVVQQALFEIERHESREWLRRDGEVYDDPHRERGV